MNDKSVCCIHGARLLDGRAVDVLIRDGRIVAVEPHDASLPADGSSLDGRGGLLIPGLHDHHVHVAATAAALASVRCGPPEVQDRDALAAAIAAPGEGWLRGVGYHESVAGVIDRRWIDEHAPDRPVRVQHRSGRLWMFNSAGLDLLLSAAGGKLPEGLDRDSGHLFDEDGWLRATLGSGPPGFAAVGRRWAQWGVTGLTDMNPQNDAVAAAHFLAERERGALPQRVVLAGLPELASVPLDADVRLGPVKVHLHEAHLPDHDGLIAGIRASHAQGRGVAVHCVTETELVFTLAAFTEAGTQAGDRIEHASVASDELIGQIAALDMAVVAQPNFVAERGDAYLADIPPDDWPHLYRLRAFRDAGVVLAGGTDTPFGAADPWAAMAAAVLRRTAEGRDFSPKEALTPEEALDLFLTDPLHLGSIRRVETGAVADLCLLKQDWTGLRDDLASAEVRATLVGGALVHDEYG